MGPVGDPSAFVRRSIASIPTAYEVNVVVEAPLTTVEEKLGSWGTATAETPSATRIEMQVDALSWPVMFLASINAPIVRADPPELRSLLDELAGHFSNVAGNDD